MVIVLHDAGLAPAPGLPQERRGEMREEEKVGEMRENEAIRGRE